MPEGNILPPCIKRTTRIIRKRLSISSSGSIFRRNSTPDVSDGRTRPSTDLTELGDPVTPTSAIDSHSQSRDIHVLREIEMHSEVLHRAAAYYRRQEAESPNSPSPLTVRFDLVPCPVPRRSRNGGNEASRMKSDNSAGPSNNVPERPATLHASTEDKYETGAPANAGVHVTNLDADISPGIVLEASRKYAQEIDHRCGRQYGGEDGGTVSWLWLRYSSPETAIYVAEILNGMQLNGRKLAATAVTEPRELL